MHVENDFWWADAKDPLCDRLISYGVPESKATALSARVCTRTATWKLSYV